MTSAEAITLFGSLGFPVAFLVFIALFFTRTIWPYIVRRVEAEDTIREKRHSAYLDQVKGFNDTANSTAKVLFILDNKFSSHDAQETERDVEIRRIINDNNISLRTFISERFDKLMGNVNATD